MAKELNEDTGFNVSIKTLIAIGFAMATIISIVKIHGYTLGQV